MEEGKHHDLETLLTMVRYKLAVQKEYTVSNPLPKELYLENRKMTPWTASMLTKEVWFTKENGEKQM